MILECYIDDKKIGAYSSVSQVMDLVISAPKYNSGESIVGALMRTVANLLSLNWSLRYIGGPVSISSKSHSVKSI